MSWLETSLPHLLLVVCQLTLSCWHFLVKNVANSSANIVLFTLVRKAVGTLLLVANCKVQGLEVMVAKEDWMRFIFLGICCAMGVCGSIFALLFIPATKYALMQPSIPVIGTIISVCFGMENLNLMKVVGITSAVLGAVLMEMVGVSSQENETNVFHEIVGISLAIIVCTCVASLVVFQKPLLSKYEPQVLCTVYYGIGTCFAISIYLIIMILPATTMIDPIVSFQLSDLYFGGDYFVLGCLAYGCIFVTLFTYNVYTYVSGLVAPSIVTIYSTVLPAWTATISFFVYNKSLTAGETLGGILIAIGLVCSVRGSMMEQRMQIKTVRTLPSVRDTLKFTN